MTSSSQSESEEIESAAPVQGSQWIGWLPISVMPLTVVSCRNLAILLGVHVDFVARNLCRPQVADLVERPAPSLSSRLAFNSLSTGLAGNGCGRFSGCAPERSAAYVNNLALAMLETTLGAILLWIVARSLPAGEPLLRGWMGMLGLILLLHFGSFQLIALAWQTFAVKARPIMSAPLRSTSLAEFWGKRWNLGFRQLSYELIFRPLYRTLGTGAAGCVVFLMSGLIHDLVISLPARAGYGLPTAYFLVQRAGITVEHTRLGKRLGLGHGVQGWLFMAVFVAGPVFWLFHPWFVLRVIVPFMQAIHAL